MSGEIKLYLCFAGIKLTGYVLGCIVLARYFGKSYSTGIFAGLARTLIGMLAGALLFYGVAYGRGMNGPVLLALLVAVRVFEWGAVFWLFFRRPLDRRVVLGFTIAIAWSFVLDFLGVVLLSGLIRGIIC